MKTSLVPKPRIGSLCTGYGGLDLAVSSVLGGEMVWCAENDKHVSKVIEKRFPGVPNHRDIKRIDWAELEPVDVLTGGYPCQPFSHAGKRKGTDDPRHLWPYICDALRVLRPRLGIFENVAGHLSLGFDVVLGDLASLGFDAEWVLVRASDVGACHRRERVFIVGTNAREVGWRNRQGQLGGLGPARLVERTDAADASDLGHKWSGDARRGWDGPEDSCGEVDWDWGEYRPAIRRHARVLGRPAPSPVDDRGRLSARFVEWMQMLPEGWVTDVIDSRPQALKILGNGVVPPQAAYALRHLLEREAVAA